MATSMMLGSNQHFILIRKELMKHVVDILNPQIYEGLTHIYLKSVELADTTNRHEMIFPIFQRLLTDVKSWNQQMIMEETNRIKRVSNSQGYFDDLVKAVIQAEIKLITCSTTVSNVISQNFYNSFTTASFVHACYVECSKDAHNHPYLFTGQDPVEIKRNQMLLQDRIKKKIKSAIRQFLPMTLILKEHLVNTINVMYEPACAPRPNPIPNPPGITNMAGITGIPEIPATGMCAVQPVADPELERDVMRIVRDEYKKTGQKRIQDIISIDKIINDINAKSAEKSQRRSDRNKPPDAAQAKALAQPSRTSNVRDSPKVPLVTVPHLQDKNSNSVPKPDKNKFDDQTTNDDSKDKSRSSRNQRQDRDRERSERVDPTKVKIAETYG